MIRITVILTALLALAGCQSTLGPRALSQTHPAYNQAVVESLSEQMLLNLVRLRYRDVPYFLKISSVTSAMTFGGNASLGGAFRTGQSGTAVSSGMGVSYADKPTISYTPLQGEDFLKSILSPISLEALLVMTQSGWSVERVFGLCVERMNNVFNAPRASGPTPDSSPEYKDFKRVLAIFRELQLTANLEVGVVSSDEEGAEELIVLIENDDLPAATSEELTRLLGYDEFQNEEPGGHVLVKISDNFLETRPDQLKIRTRSIASVMYYLSQNIDIPSQHQRDGLITVTRGSNGGIFDWGATPAGSVFQVKSSEHYPDNAYLAVPYRGYWFYIADNDLQSKSTFLLLSQLFDLQAGQTDYSGPTLTLPVR